MRTLVFLAAVLALLAVSTSADVLRCPSVLDGLALMGDFDLQEQQATSVIGGHWSGLEESEVLAYEYAVVSEKLLSSDFGTACRASPGFIGVPDVVDWQFMRKQTAFADSHVDLQVGTQYFVIVRTVLSNGAQVYSSSNGVRVVPPHPSSLVADELAAPKASSQQRTARSTLDPVNAVNGACPIDAANRCRQAAKTPGALLTEIYGPPQFSTSGQINTLFLIPTTPQDAINIGMDPLDSRQARELRGLAGDQQALPEFSDDDDEFSAVLPGVAIAGIVVPITVGTMVLMALLALIAWLIASSGGRDYREGSRVVSSAPSRTGATAPAAAPAAPPPNDTVRMDFPDLDVRS